MTLVMFDVVGIPRPQGSKVAFKAKTGAVVSKESGGNNFAAWRNAVADKAREQAEIEPTAPLDGPLKLHVEFRFPMPASRPNKLRELGEVPKTTAPDLSKLVRALEDALQAGGLIYDDARITQLDATKVEVADGWCGAHIRIAPIGNR